MVKITCGPRGVTRNEFLRGGQSEATKNVGAHFQRLYMYVWVGVRDEVECGSFLMEGVFSGATGSTEAYLFIKSF